MKKRQVAPKTTYWLYTQYPLSSKILKVNEYAYHVQHVINCQ